MIGYSAGRNDQVLRLRANEPSIGLLSMGFTFAFREEEGNSMD